MFQLRLFINRVPRAIVMPDHREQESFNFEKKTKTVLNENDYGEFKGTTQEAIRDIREDVRAMRGRLDTICVDHESRIKSIETAARIFKWLYAALFSLLVYLGLKP